MSAAPWPIAGAGLPILAVAIALIGLCAVIAASRDKVVQHGKRADAIVKNMLLHSRQGSGEHRSVDINALVDESLKNLVTASAPIAMMPGSS